MERDYPFTTRSGGGVAFPVGRSHGTGWWCVMGGFQTFYGCCSKSEEWMLLGICKALVKNVCSCVLLMLPGISRPDC